MSQNIFIREVTNTGSQSIRITFHEAAGGTIATTLDPGSSSNMLMLDLSATTEKNPILFTVSLASNLGLIRSVQLYYDETASGNQFQYAMVKPSQLEFKKTSALTSPDTDVTLEIAYEGDGVVVVGTGDFIS